MGGLYGSYLSRGDDVTMVDINAEVVDKINREGFEVREPDGSSNIFHPKGATTTAGMEPVDLIIIFLNSRFSESALNANKAIIGPNTCLMTLQNGSGHEATLGKFVPQENIIIGTTQHNANVAGPGITNHGGSGMTHIGCVTGSASRFQAIADSFTACGLQTDVSDDVQKMIWNKMFTNVSASALTAVLQMPLGYISLDPFAWGLLPEADPRDRGRGRRAGHGFRLQPEGGRGQGHLRQFPERTHQHLHRHQEGSPQRGGHHLRLHRPRRRESGRAYAEPLLHGRADPRAGGQDREVIYICI